MDPAPGNDGRGDGGGQVRLLLVEDDAGIRRVLAMGLHDEGFAVLEAANAEQGLVLLRRGVDVALVDLMLPGMDGIELCRRLRVETDLPIIVVTARSDTDDVIAGLEAGADDYVTKPVVARELGARVRALLRRTQRAAPPATEVRLGELVLRPDAGTVTRSGAEIGLTRTEFGLLSELARAGGNVVSREELLTRVWGYGYFGDTRLLDVHVRRLRRKIEPDPDSPTLVLTVRGRGYRAGS